MATACPTMARLGLFTTTALAVGAGLYFVNKKVGIGVMSLGVVWPMLKGLSEIYYVGAFVHWAGKKIYSTCFGGKTSTEPTETKQQVPDSNDTDSKVLASSLSDLSLSDGLPEDSEYKGSHEENDALLFAPPQGEVNAKTPSVIVNHNPGVLARMLAAVSGSRKDPAKQR